MTVKIVRVIRSLRASMEDVDLVVTCNYLEHARFGKVIRPLCDRSWVRLPYVSYAAYRYFTWKRHSQFVLLLLASSVNFRLYDTGGGFLRLVILLGIATEVKRFNCRWPKYRAELQNFHKGVSLYMLQRRGFGLASRVLISFFVAMSLCFSSFLRLLAGDYTSMKSRVRRLANNGACCFDDRCIHANILWQHGTKTRYWEDSVWDWSHRHYWCVGYTFLEVGTERWTILTDGWVW